MSDGNSKNGVFEKELKATLLTVAIVVYHGISMHIEMSISVKRRLQGTHIT